MLELLNYELLRLVWWLLLGVLLIGYAIMDGFDLGVATLIPFIAKTDTEKRILINTVGPVWEGNQVWLLLGGGAIFAAWPMVYAVSFSGLYLAIMLLLATLILRPVAFKFRSKVEDKRWRMVWDICLFVSGLVPALVCGVAVGNAVLGIPFYLDETMLSHYTGSFFALFSPFALLTGLMSVFMIISHSTVYTAIKTEGSLQERALKIFNVSIIVTLVLYIVGMIFVKYFIEGYVITSTVDGSGPSAPLNKEVTKELGVYFTNLVTRPLALLSAALVFAGALFAKTMVAKKAFGKAFIGTSFMIAGIVSTAGNIMFPFILPSSLDPVSSLTVWDASSSHMTLLVMLVATLIFFPLIVLYTSWVYSVLRGKVTESTIENAEGDMY